MSAAPELARVVVPVHDGFETLGPCLASVAATLTVYVTSTNATIGTLTGDGSGRFRGNLNFGTNPGNITVKSSGGGSATRSVIAK